MILVYNDSNNNSINIDIYEHVSYIVIQLRKIQQIEHCILYLQQFVLVGKLSPF